MLAILKGISSALVVGCGLLLAAPATAQADYPDRPIRIIVGFGPGSGTDIISRIVAEEMTRKFGQPVIVENVPGASTQIAASKVKEAEPDGYTLFLTSNSSHNVNPHVFKNLAYDPMKDFTPIGRVGFHPWFLVVNPDVPAKTAPEFVEWARANKGSVIFAYSSTAVQIPSAALNTKFELDATGVAYKSSPEAMLDVANGAASFMVVDIASSRSNVESGKLRPLAVTNGKRSALASDLPTLKEAFGRDDLEFNSWTGLFGPAALPPEVVATLNDTLAEILARPDIQERLHTLGAEAWPMETQEFTGYVEGQLGVWGELIKEAGIEPQ